MLIHNNVVVAAIHTVALYFFHFVLLLTRKQMMLTMYCGASVDTLESSSNPRPIILHKNESTHFNACASISGGVSAPKTSEPDSENQLETQKKS